MSKITKKKKKRRKHVERTDHTDNDILFNLLTPVNPLDNRDIECSDKSSVETKRITACSKSISSHLSLIFNGYITPDWFSRAVLVLSK